MSNDINNDTHNNTITIHGQFDEQDWVKINSISVKQTHFFKKLWLVYLLLAILIVTSIVYLADVWGQYDQEREFYLCFRTGWSYFYDRMLFPLTFLVFLISYTVKLIRVPKTAARIMLKDPANRLMFTPFTLTLNDQQLQITRQYTQGIYQWESVTKVVDTALFVLIFVGTSPAVSIKKTDCNEDELQKILVLIQRNFKGDWLHC